MAIGEAIEYEKEEEEKEEEEEEWKFPYSHYMGEYEMRILEKVVIAQFIVYALFCNYQDLIV